MIALYIEIDGAASVVAGAANLQVLALALGCHPQAASTNQVRVQQGLAPQAVFDLSVTGMAAGTWGTHGEAMHWVEGLPLQAGQTVTVTVIETARTDPALPARVMPAPAKSAQAHFEHCKRVYLELKDKYDPPQAG